MRRVATLPNLLSGVAESAPGSDAQERARSTARTTAQEESSDDKTRRTVGRCSTDYSKQSSGDDGGRDEGSTREAATVAAGSGAPSSFALSTIWVAQAVKPICVDLIEFLR